MADSFPGRSCTVLGADWEKADRPNRAFAALRPPPGPTWPVPDDPLTVLPAVSQKTPGTPERPEP
ncbi:hypothetical protein KPATCC21470_4469 [Kitasatospora purpeofusca]